MPEEELTMLQLQQALNKATNYNYLKEKIVNATFDQPLAISMLCLGFISFMTINHQTGSIDQAAFSDNVTAQAIRYKNLYDATDWYYTLAPALTVEQAGLNQASGDIAYSAVYSLNYAAIVGTALVKHYGN